MEWSPSFECHVRPDGEHVYRIGHQLIDEFLEFVVGRARPNTVRAYAHDLSVFFSVVKKDPLEVRPKDVMAFVTAQRRPKPGAENVVRIRRLSGSLGGDDQAASGGGLELLWLPDHPRRRGGDGQPGAPGHRHPSEPLTRRSWPAAGARCAPAAQDPRPRRDRRAHGCAAHRAGPGHDPGHGARRSAALRGARSSPGRPASRRVAGADQRRQGRPRTIGAAVADLLLHAWLATWTTSDRRDDERRALRRAQRGPSRPAALDAGPGPDHPRPPGCAPNCSHGTCHELRHTCFTRLREAGMAIEAIQAQAGHRSITSTRVYLHLDIEWLAEEYRRAIRSHRGPGACRGGPMNALARATARQPTSSRRRDARSHVEPDRRPGTGHGRHHGLLPGPTRSLGPSGHRGGCRAGTPASSPTGSPRPIRAARRWRASGGPTSRTSSAGWSHVEAGPASPWPP